MATAALRARAERENLQVLNPFLDVLRSPVEIAIPKDTLQGALGHFTATLDGENLDSFIQDVVSSPSLWKVLDGRDVQGAVRHAPTIKVDALRPVIKDGWIRRNQLNKESQAWLSSIFKAIKKTGITDHSIFLLTGILAGLDDEKSIDWGKPRIALEEAIVIALGERFEKNSCNALEMFCSAADHIDMARLRALDLRQVVPRLNLELFSSLGFPPPPSVEAYNDNTVHPDDVDQMSRALARCFSALSEGGPSSQEFAWEELVAFSKRMYADCATKLVDEMGSFEPSKGSREWDRQKEALYAFITVAWPGVTIMLDPHRHPSAKQSAELSEVNILTLAKFASMTESEGVIEGYEKLLYGSLDVLAAEGGPRGVRRVFDRLWEEEHTEQLSAFVLLVAEQLVHLLDAQTLRDRVLPLASEYVSQPRDKPAFEASNAFLLVLLEVAASNIKQDPSQAAFVESMVKILCHGFLKEAQEGHITTEQLGPAYTAVVSAAARHDVQLVQYAIDQLEKVSFDTQAYKQTINLIRISCIPFIPRQEMAEYLDRITWVILDAPQASESRLELAAHAYKVIMNNIPDESKQMGIEWWLRHRRVFQSQKEQRAKL